MAELVLAIGSSHSPLLASPPEDYAEHAKIDASGRPLIDKEGKSCTYGELLSRADPTIADQIRMEVLEERAARCNAAIDRLANDIASAELDALVIIGDDQHEQYFEDNMPSILVYWGETIHNTVLDLPGDAPAFWKIARGQYHESAGVREYPVAADLGRHVIEHLIANEFDVSHSQKLARDRGEGHAFGFVHKRLMRDHVVPILPVALNTYFPPNQPLPRRCYRLGQEINKAVQSWPGQKRVGILASGGLSHFTVNEELDRTFLKACQHGDKDYFSTLSPTLLQSGSSEMRNWITVAGAAESLTMSWHDYVPCYRSPAGTGCGMGFALWR